MNPTQRFGKKPKVVVQKEFTELPTKYKPNIQSSTILQSVVE